MACYVIGSLLLFIAVDVFDLWGSRAVLVASPLHEPIVWYLLHWEGHFTEWLQWALQGAFIAVSARNSELARSAGSQVSQRFWTTMSVLGVLLLIEDAGNARHVIAHYTVLLSGDPVMRLAAELVFYLILGAVALYGLMIHFAAIRPSPTSKRYMIAGTVAYGSIGLASATRRVGDWYSGLGDYIRWQLFDGRLIPLEYRHPLYPEQDATSFYLVDQAIEEPIELIAIALLVSAALTYLHEARSDPQVFVVPDGLWSRKSLLRRG